MNRRDFAKGLAALPLLRAVESFGSTGSELNNESSYLMVTLEGGFAVVVSTAPPWRVQAFTPKHKGEHFFAFNRQVCETGTKYGFLLQQDGLTPAKEFPFIYNSHPGFYAEKTPYDLSMQDHFVLLDLPAPKSILIRSSHFKAVMESDTCENPTYVRIPGTQSLIYEIKDKKAIQMYGSEYGEVEPLDALKVSDRFWAFKFEVGLPNRLGGRDSDPNGLHAIDFYNESVLPHFSQLGGNKAWRIRKILEASSDSGYQQSLPSGIEGLKQTFESYLLATTFECKIGGLTATSP